MKRFLSILIVCAGLFSVGLAHCEESVGYKNFRLGDDLNEIRKDKRLICSEDKRDIYADAGCVLGPRFNETIAGVPVKSVVLAFWRLKLHTIIVEIASKDYTEVLVSMSEKYGWTVPSTEEVQNRMGAKYLNRVYQWNIGDAKIRAIEYSGTLDKSEIIFESEKALSDFYERKGMDSKRRSGDL